MTNPHLQKILLQIQAENSDDAFNHKICLIEDIIKAKKSLYGFGQTQHNEWINKESAGELFNELYELDTIQLEITMKGYCAQINEIFKKRMVFCNPEE